MKRLLAIAALAAAMTSASAITIDASRFFAYVRHTGNGFHIMLSHSPCPLQNKGFTGYAEQVPPHVNNPWPSCWKTDAKSPNVVVICAIVDKKEIGACQFVSKDFFRDVASLPRSAF